MNVVYGATSMLAILISFALWRLSKGELISQRMDCLNPTPQVSKSYLIGCVIMAVCMKP